MKSGPTLAAATRVPRAARAAMRPVATVVLPTPECVPATTRRGPRTPATSAGLDLEDRVVAGDGEELLVGRVRAGAAEELADLPLPSAQVLAQDGHGVVTGDLCGREGLCLLAEAQLAGPGDAQVLHPRRDAAGRHQVLVAVELEQVDGRRAPLAGGAAAHRQDPRPLHAETGAREAGNDAVEDVLREPAGGLIVVAHRFILSAPASAPGPFGAGAGRPAPTARPPPPGPARGGPRRARRHGRWPRRLRSLSAGRRRGPG